MKRFIVMLLLITAIVGVLTYYMPRGLETYIQDISTNATVSIYCRITDMDNISMGNGKIVQCCVADFNSVLARCNEVDGLSISFSGTEQDILRIVQLFNLKISSTLNLDGLRIICGNSNKLTGGVILDGVAVNLQIAYKDGTVTVGSPLILGSY